MLRAVRARHVAKDGGRLAQAHALRGAEAGHLAKRVDGFERGGALLALPQVDGREVA